MVAIDEKLKRMPQTIRVGSRAGGLSEFLSIQAAINYCDAQGGDWIIEIYSQVPGGYNEGNITPNGGANITLRGMGVERVAISPVAVPVAAVIVSGFTLTLDNLIVAAPDNTRPALRVTGGACHAVSSTLAGVGAGDSIQQVAGDLTLDGCRVPQDIDLSTAACDLWVNFCLLEGGIDTAGNFAHRMWIKECNFNNSALNSAAIGNTLLFMEGCSYVGVVANAGTGVFTIRGSYITEIWQTNAGGFTYILGGDVVICGSSVGVVTWSRGNEYKVIAGMKIAHALLVAVAGSEIVVGPGVFAESNLAMLANVNLVGTDPDQTQIILNSAANPIVTSAVNCSISNLTIGNLNAAMPAVAVSANTLNLRNCIVYGTGAGDAIAMTGGTLVAYDTTIGAGDIDLSTAICTLSMYRCRITTDPVDTAATAFAHVLTFEQCDFGNQSLVSAATGATTLAMHNCVNVNIVSNAGTGAFTIRNSDINTITVSNAAGSAVIRGGSINACGGAVGSIVWKLAAQQYEVYAGMKIQHAITAAAADTPAPSATAPYTVLIHPGIYDEAVTMSTYVNLRGIGTKGAVVIYRNDATVITLATQVQIENLTVRLGAASAGVRCIYDGNVACICLFTDLIFEVTTPGINGPSICYADHASSNLTFVECYCNIGGTGPIKIVDSDGTITLRTCDFTLGVSSTGEVIKSAGSFTCINCNLALLNPVQAGTAGAIHAVAGGNLLLANCTVVGRIYNGSNTGRIRIKNSSIRTITRVAGNIVDESPYPANYAFHVLKKFWEVALAHMNIVTRAAIGGTVIEGGGGQARLRINDNAADAAGVESPADAAGALASTFDPAKTPRYCQQISVNAFRATTTMFFGLRAVLGAAVPGAAEHHAGFIWTGAAFNASSSNGGGVGGTTALANPSTGVQHQLEVIVLGGVQVEFYVDGVLVATHTTDAKIPTAALYFQEYEISNGGGGATTSDITLREGFLQECPA